MTGDTMCTDIAGPTPSFYVAVLLYESSSDAPSYEPLYEECFVLIRASTQEEAEARARAHAQQNEQSYQNADGETIRWRPKRVIDVNAVLDDALVDGAELYARHFRDLEAYSRFEPLLSDDEPRDA